ncbi:hypothetical protein [Deinococcus hohokamensis]|uniref:Nudix hydrolase domain-containing protein n=1 Tax=Deinococcus hohokamensis TaxID=309883 RepID=A0ABV9I7N7_9DEIO
MRAYENVFEALRREVHEETGLSLTLIPSGHTAFGTAPDGFDTEYKVPQIILTHVPLPSVEREGAAFTSIMDGLSSRMRLGQQNLLPSECTE